MTEELDTLDWRPVERTAEDGTVTKAAVCYITAEDGILTLDRVLFEADRMNLNVSEMTMYVSGDYLIIECPAYE